MSKSKNEIKVFLDISVLLTGFNQNDLLGTGMLETYYYTIEANSNPDVLNFFYEEVKRILKIKDRKQVNVEIKCNLMPDSAYRKLAKNIIIMWYMGNWNGSVVSAESYTNGLVWMAADTHPPGAKQPGYASWSQPPIKISCNK